ncbi:hypothetical protein QUH15_26895, partial [Klebsiella pneumoniae]|uniref:hypothetical protein n=2 Tax=Klebsiella pneumoniae TaxID=573 RepID=UPI0025A0EFC2
GGAALNSQVLHQQFTSIFCTRLLNYSRFSMVRYGKRYGSVVQQDDLSQHYIKECWRLFSISMRMHTPFP